MMLRQQHNYEHRQKKFQTRWRLPLQKLQLPKLMLPWNKCVHISISRVVTAFENNSHRDSGSHLLVRHRPQRVDCQLHTRFVDVLRLAAVAGDVLHRLFSAHSRELIVL